MTDKKTNKPDWENKTEEYLEKNFEDAQEMQRDSIRGFVRSTIQAEKEALIEEIIKAAPKLAQNSLTRWGKEGDTYAKAFEKELLDKLNKKGNYPLTTGV